MCQPSPAPTTTPLRLLREFDARVRKRSTVRASHALARRTSIQHVKELIAKQLNETDSNSTVTRIGEQVDGGTFVDGTRRESIPLPVCPYINLVPTPPSTAARTKLCTVSLSTASLSALFSKTSAKAKEHVPHDRVHACVEYHDLFRPTGRGDSADTWKCSMFPAIVLFFSSSCGQYTR